MLSDAAQHAGYQLVYSRAPGPSGRFASALNAEAETLCISTITVTELFHGAARSAKPVENRQEVERMVARLTVLDFDSRAAAHAGEIYANLGLKGELIGPYDILIAGHARSLGLIVITGNLREFQRVPGLRSEDWLPSA